MSFPFHLGCSSKDYPFALSDVLIFSDVDKSCRLKDLSTIDLSHNKLGTIPDAIRSSDGLIVLDVGHNRVESSSGVS